MPKSSNPSPKANSSKPILYGYWRSSASWRVRWALNIKKVETEHRFVNLLKGEQHGAEFLKINPAGQIPTLMINGKAYGESMAMLEYLEETYPQNPILPQDPESRMFVRQLALTIVAGTHPLQNMHPQQYHSPDPTERKKFAQHFIKRGLSFYEKRITQSAGSYSFGGQVTMADICLVPQVYNALRNDIDLNHYPTIKGIYERCLKLPECVAAAPDQQGDAVKN
jgi:maleylacetoacetate isomerase